MSEITADYRYALRHRKKYPERLHGDLTPVEFDLLCALADYCPEPPGFLLDDLAVHPLGDVHVLDLVDAARSLINRGLAERRNDSGWSRRDWWWISQAGLRLLATPVQELPSWLRRPRHSDQKGSP